MKFKPLGHRILVRQESLEAFDPVYQRAKKAGIALAETDELKREQNGVDAGIVLELGNTAFKDFGDWDVKIGDKVYFAKYSGKILKNPNEPDVQYVVLNDDDLVAKVEND